jgi:hypothetical protein
MQVSITITNNINFNLTGSILSSNAHSPNTNAMNIHMDDDNNEEEDQQDDNDDNESGTDSADDTDASDAHFLTPPKSDEDAGEPVA